MTRYQAAWIANCLALAGGMAVSWFRGTEPSPVVSFLLSISNNGGHRQAAIVGLFLSSCLLAYAVAGISSMAVRVSLWLGCLGLAVMALLAFRIESLGNVHDMLSALTLLALLVGVFTGARAEYRHTPHFGLKIFLYFLAVTMLLLMCAYLIPNYFDDSHWWRNLALAEWTLIALIQTGILFLLRRNQIRTSSR